VSNGGETVQRSLLWGRGEERVVNFKSEVSVIGKSIVMWVVEKKNHPRRGNTGEGRNRAVCQ